MKESTFSGPIGNISSESEDETVLVDDNVPPTNDTSRPVKINIEIIMKPIPIARKIVKLSKSAIYTP